MRKLTSKVKYRVVDGHAELYAARKDTGQFECFATCHLSVLDYIKTNGMKAAAEGGLLRMR